MRGYVKLSNGILIPPPDVHSGWTTRKNFPGIRARKFKLTTISRASGSFEDEWLREGQVRRWVPKGYADRPVYTFETGGSTGVPKSRINIEDFRLDYEAFSHTLAGRILPDRRRLVISWTNWSKAPATCRRTPGAVSRWDLFHG